MSELKLKIMTPDRIVIPETLVEELTAPGILGEFGILPGHALYLTELGEGKLAYKKGDKTVSYSIAGGLASVAGDSVIILADSALPAIQ